MDPHYHSKICRFSENRKKSRNVKRRPTGKVGHDQRGLGPSSMKSINLTFRFITICTSPILSTATLLSDGISGVGEPACSRLVFGKVAGRIACAEYAGIKALRADWSIWLGDD